MPELTLENLVSGLETFSDRYQALDVFIADVSEIRALASGAQVPGLLREEDASSFVFRRNATWYRLQLFVDDGVARLTRNTVQPPQDSNAGSGAVVGGALGAALGAAVASKKEALGGAAAGLLLGLLVGAALGSTSAAGASPPRKVFALCFDPALGKWRAYDGGLVRWMKSQLAPPSVLEGLPQ